MSDGRAGLSAAETPMRMHQRASRLMAGLLLLLLGLGSALGDTPSTVNGDAKAKAKAKQAAIKAFEEEHGTVFDSYGRVMKWGKKATKTECRKKKTGDGSDYICEVKASEERKYRTKEETTRQQVIKLDRQAEADRIGGDDSKDAETMKRLKKENRARCSLFKDWLVEYEKDVQDKKPQFFNYLSSNYEDYGELQKLARQGNKREERKASKLYRHIAKESHTDRLPDGCKGEEFVTMMVRGLHITALTGCRCCQLISHTTRCVLFSFAAQRDVLNKADGLKECVSDPATCSDGAAGGMPGGGGRGGPNFNHGGFNHGGGPRGRRHH